jgi:exopolysaccharide production protein ExoQ
MPPQLALALSLAFSAVLLWRELKQHPELSIAVWIPTLWLLILGSRSVSQWLNLSTPTTADALLDGSPLDRTVFAILMACALVVLLRRRVPWGRIIVSNPWLMVFIAYCGLSVLWSDFPSLAIKRWSKSLGDPLMVLILMTEVQPFAAFASVLRRCAFLLIPLSIVFIKYFPQLGRDVDPWSGVMFYTGVATNKNMLGYLLFALGLYFLCTVFTRETSSAGSKSQRRTELAIATLFLLMIAYLFVTINSKTPVMALAVATMIAAGLGQPFVRRYFGSFAVIALVLGGLAQFVYNAGGAVVESAGRDLTLTGRTELWATLLPMASNPLLGTGFQSFWLGDRLRKISSIFEFRPNQAHNGYIEIYLNLGLIGVLLFCGLLATGFVAAKRRLMAITTREDPPWIDVVQAKFAMSFLVAYVLYSLTEAVFQPLNVLFIVCLALVIKYPTHIADRLVLPVPEKPAARLIPVAASAGVAPTWVPKRGFAVKSGWQPRRLAASRLDNNGATRTSRRGESEQVSAAVKKSPRWADSFRRR